jgi:hypothetical protein
MKELMYYSCLFTDKSLYKKNEMDKPKSDFEKRLIGGRIAEIDFYESNLRKEFFNYKGDSAIYEVSLNNGTKYDSMDFLCKFGGIGVDVKTVHGSSIIQVPFHGKKLHNEQAFSKKEIDKYLNQVQYPFLLIYSDFEFKPNEHRIFVDLRTAFDYMDKEDTIEKACIRRREVYRINLDYQTQKTQFLYTYQEFTNFMYQVKSFYDGYLYRISDNLGNFFPYKKRRKSKR